LLEITTFLAWFIGSLNTLPFLANVIN
jgi:hypothetical protein